MNNAEERIWNYIDGACTPAEQEAIGKLIETEEAYRLKYEELLLLNAQLQSLEADEPPMAFTYNVMEAIRTEQAQQPLKAAINKNIVYGIAAFFIFSITATLIYLLTAVKWTAGHSVIPAPDGAQIAAIKNYFTGPVIKTFMFFNVILILALFDGYLRRQHTEKRSEL